MLSNKTTKVLAIFTAVATTAAFASWLAEDADISADQEDGVHTLTDDSGQEYTLTENDDGTETATYEDGRTVTFRREEDGGLNYIAGSAGLLAGLAAGYYMFHGLSSGGGGYYNASTHRYTTNSPIKPLEKEKDRTTSNIHSSTRSSSKKTVSAKSFSTSGAKSGFGSAGARSSAS
ncbi:MAG: hypothetical protein K6F95_11310 [Selenomonas sp.]|uniref:hypothetical protein n=1 Tax=Selenomonas sp. TaxID=2053611 RepID=UPI0025E808E6|nr:hypothetical protein [Selenomonas sp.]MCR5758477.1 hypothetical protein [Selenomonas sp.]